MFSWQSKSNKNKIEIAAINEKELRALIHINGKNYTLSHPISNWMQKEWHHIKLSWLTDETVRLDVDGKQVAKLDNVNLARLANTNGSLQIGSLMRDKLQRQ